MDKQLDLFSTEYRLIIRNDFCLNCLMKCNNDYCCDKCIKSCAGRLACPIFNYMPKVKLRKKIETRSMRREKEFRDFINE